MIFQSLYIFAAIMTLQFEEGSWTAPGIRIEEEMRIDPFEYVQEGQSSIGFAVTEEDESGSSLKLILIDDDNVYVIPQYGSAEIIPYEFDAEIFRFSPNGSFIAFWDIYTDQCGRLDLSTGELEVFSPFQISGCSYPKMRVTDSGSLIFLIGTLLRIYDSNLDEIVSNDDHYFTNSSVGYSDKGKVICISNGNNIDAYNDSGELIWTIEADLLPEPRSNQYGRIYVSPDGNSVCATVNGNEEIITLDGCTGEVLNRNLLAGVVDSDLKFSSDSRWLAYNPVTVSEDYKERTEITALMDYDTDIAVKDEANFSYSCPNYEIWLNVPWDVSDNGLQLYLLSKYEGPEKYSIYNSECELIHCTDWTQASGSTQNDLRFHGFLKDDGTGFCYFDGRDIVFYTIGGV